MKALIFDCDGVLVDTERDGHRVAYNQAFARFDLDVEWDVATYGKLLKVAGGKERMRHHFETTGWPSRTGTDKDRFLAELHREKTAIFTRLIASGKLPLRPGILRMIDEAIQSDVRLGVCTTSAPKSISAVLDLMGPERKNAFEFVLAGDIVTHKKPDPEIYELAKKILGLPPGECMVIEDSRIGMLAAINAGLPCFITTSTYTLDEDFSGSIGIARELGDPPDPSISLSELGSLIA